MNLRFLAIAAVLAAGPVAAESFRIGQITIDTPWARETAPGQSAGGGYMSILNRGKTADRLVGGSSPVAAKIEVHTMTMDGGVMRMRPVVGGLEIPAGGSVGLRPGGYHIMLIGLKAPLRRGTEVPVTLRFQRAGSVAVTLKVESISHGIGGGK